MIFNIPNKGKKGLALMLMERMFFFGAKYQTHQTINTKFAYLLLM